MNDQNSTVSKLNGSNPALNIGPAVSEPSLSSISVVQKSSSFFKFFIIATIIITLIVAGAGVFFIFKKAKQQKEDVALAEQQAKEVKRVNAQPIQQLDEFNDDQDSDAAANENDDRNVFFNLISTPAGAEVFNDGIFMGVTPIDVKFEKSEKDLKIVIALEGYDIERRTVPLTESFSENINLNEIIVEDVPEEKPVVAPRRTDDNVINLDGPKRRKHGKDKNKPSEDDGLWAL